MEYPQSDARIVRVDFAYPKIPVAPATDVDCDDRIPFPGFEYPDEVDYTEPEIPVDPATGVEVDETGISFTGYEFRDESDEADLDLIDESDYWCRVGLVLPDSYRKAIEDSKRAYEKRCLLSTMEESV